MQEIHKIMTVMQIKSNTKYPLIHKPMQLSDSFPIASQYSSIHSGIQGSEAVNDDCSSLQSLRTNLFAEASRDF